MPFDPTIAAIRFGMGLSPTIAPPTSVDDMMARLIGPDEIAETVPIPKYADAFPSLLDLRDASRELNRARDTDGEEAALARRQEIYDAAHAQRIDALRADLIRATHTKDGFRERLTLFWADHFTARPTRNRHRHLVSSYIEEAIRPNVTGPFADMLVSVVRSPIMIMSLDQNRSYGPNSDAAMSNDRGLNENLAREMLELHTLGVGGSYTQNDVREFAELLTGVTSNAVRGAYYEPNMAEPGAETVLGVTYGGGEEAFDNVRAALHDLALHPDTARHLSRKLVVHFIGPNSDAALIDMMAARYLESGGELSALYEVLLAHESAWMPQTQKVKQPFDFIASSIRALGVPQGDLFDVSIRDIRRYMLLPLRVMGQERQNPVGPNGWPEDAESWITPQGMAGRITWAMQTPERLLDRLPDPREFARTALGPTPPDAVLFAAHAAETVSDGIGIVLASAAFQRR